jgi:transcriptional regulator with XRE-family HTH domain
VSVTKRYLSSVGTISASVVKLPGLLRQRLLATLTQEELAAKAGVRRPTITRLERGGETRPATIRKLADALGCTSKDLLDNPETKS